MALKLRASQIIRELHPEFQGYFPHGSGRAYSDLDGIWYERPKSYPAILFDDQGYVILGTKEELNTALRRMGQGINTRQINLPRSIKSLKLYRRCYHSHSELLQ